MRRSKVIFVHLLNDYSGSPNVLSQVIDATLLNEDVSEVELYVGSSGIGFLSDKECVTETFFYRRSANKFFTLAMFLLSQIILFVKLLKYRKHDVLIYINTMLPFGAGLAGKLMGKTVIYHVHETSLTPRLFKLFLRWVIDRTASQVIYVSEYLRRVEGFNNANQRVVYNCLPKEFSESAADNTYPFKSDSFNVLMACSLKPYKGVNEFVTIANMCAHRTDVFFTLILNCLDHDITEYFSGFDLPKNMQLIPCQTDLRKFYRDANLLLNLSKPDEWVETFGLTIFEAMSYGIPAIAPSIGGPIELVRDGQDGYLINSTDTKAIAKKIVDLSDNRELCNDLSISARERSLGFSQSKFRKAISEAIID